MLQQNGPKTPHENALASLPLRGVCRRYLELNCSLRYRRLCSSAQPSPPLQPFTRPSRFTETLSSDPTQCLHRTGTEVRARALACAATLCMSLSPSPRACATCFEAVLLTPLVSLICLYSQLCSALSPARESQRRPAPAADRPRRNVRLLHGLSPHRFENPYFQLLTQDYMLDCFHCMEFANRRCRFECEAWRF